MLSKDEIIQNLSSSGRFIDNFILDAFIKNWKIDPIYEDENGIEYFDDVSFEKIKKLFLQRDNLKKNNEKNCEENFVKEDDIIIKEEIKNSELKIGKIDNEVCGTDLITKENNNVKLNSITFDLVGENIENLTQKIAKNITSQFETYLCESDFVDRVLKAGDCKDDNKYLARKVKDIIQENAKLKEKISNLEKDSKSFVKVFGNFYIKKNK